MIPPVWRVFCHEVRIDSIRPCGRSRATVSTTLCLVASMPTASSHVLSAFVVRFCGARPVHLHKLGFTVDRGLELAPDLAPDGIKSPNTF